ncbi:MAG: hypothetical protein JWN44_1079 [Myxococcales bacterium]|nr:hypothetical protein [Myxococcales bacterium]
MSAVPHEVVFKHLARYLGPHTARTAIRTFADRALKRTPEQISLQDAPALLLALKPMMRTLIGADECEAVLRDIGRELGL